MTRENPSEVIRVVLVDDHTMFRDGTKALLGEDSTIDVVGEADSAAYALDVIEESRPDIALVDVRLNDGSGIKLAKAIKEQRPEVRLVVVTAYNHHQYVKAMAKIGVWGYLLKECSGAELIQAIHDVYEGRVALATGVGATLIDLVAERRPRSPRELSDELTIRELEVLELLQQGSTNGQIAQLLGVSTKTVNTHVGHILSKLGEPNRVMAVARAKQIGLLAAIE